MIKINQEVANKLKRKYDGSDEFFLPVEWQKKWFYQDNPNGAIILSVPQMSPDRRPGEFVVTVRIYKEKPASKEECPDIQLSSRAQAGEDQEFDAYANCQIKAVRTALRDLGYWIEGDLESEIKKAEESIALSISKDAELVEGDDNSTDSEVSSVFFDKNSKDLEGDLNNTEAEKDSELVKHDADKSIQENHTSSDAENSKGISDKPTNNNDDSDKKNSTKTKVEDVSLGKDSLTDDQSSPAKDTESKKEDIMEDDKKEYENSVKDTNKEDDEKSNKKILSDIKVDKNLEGARNVEVTYKTYKGKTIGELVDSGSKRDLRLVEWFAKSSVAEEKFPKEAEAAKIVLGI